MSFADHAALMLLIGLLALCVLAISVEERRVVEALVSGAVAVSSFALALAAGGFLQ